MITLCTIQYICTCTGIWLKSCRRTAKKKKVRALREGRRGTETKKWIVPRLWLSWPWSICVSRLAARQVGWLWKGTERQQQWAATELKKKWRRHTRLLLIKVMIVLAWSHCIPGLIYIWLRHVCGEGTHLDRPPAPDGPTCLDGRERSMYNDL